DRISILKLGRKVGEITPERLRALDRHALVEEIVAMMFGRQAGDDAVIIPPRVTDGDYLLEVRDLSVTASADAPGLQSVSFGIGHGEIFGIAGIDGNGQKQLAEAIAGQTAIAGGSIRLDGTPLDALDV